MPQGGTQWAHGRLDSPQPAVNLAADYTPATTYMITSRDSYPAQAQSHCSGHYPYPSQPYPSSLNYVLPPYDFAKYPINEVNGHHVGQYSPHPSAPTHYQYPPSDPITFHSAYDPTGYFPSDGPLCSPLVGQHQHSLVPVPSSYSRYDDYVEHYEHYTQCQIPSTLPSSSSSELSHALVETPPPESQSISHGSIALPMLSPSAPKRNPSETLVSIKTECVSGDSGQPLSLMTSMSALPPSSELAPLPKEESKEQFHVFPTRVVTHGRLQHQPHTHYSFRLAQDPTAVPGFTSLPTSKRPPSHGILGSLVYSPSHTPGRHERDELVAGTTGSDVGAKPQGRARCVEAAIDKTACTAQTCNGLLVLP
ncbi:hypothetical protein BJY52DRAFT_1191761 [Lactarius psammicola]|nr:hypothetical protein BJY52DRAFT_1191761 [Lactarius psammicola]